jgi:hypothetical protein
MPAPVLAFMKRGLKSLSTSSSSAMTALLNSGSLINRIARQSQAICPLRPTGKQATPPAGRLRQKSNYLAQIWLA